MLDLSKYTEQIPDETDKPLFAEAIDCAKAGAYRAAYVMLWIACAESLKRRFREAQVRDSTAGLIVGDLEQKETDHKAVDKFLLDKAKEYGFLGELAYNILFNIYQMRCVYGHPYEEDPKEEEVVHAAAMIVEHVLSQPVKLRHGFAKTLLKSLLEDQHYLDDNNDTITSFAKEILPRIDERIVGWLLEEYWKELEKIASDASMTLFRDRGVLFSRAALNLCGVAIFTDEQWHDKVSLYPKILIRVLGRKPLFKGVGERAQDYIIGAALEQAHTHPSILQYLELLLDKGAFSERQQERFVEYLKTMDSGKLQKAHLTTKTCFCRIISELKSHDWYRQKPVVGLVIANGSAEIATLREEEQEQLGRNILQTADGEERLAKRFLNTIADEPKKWPLVFLKGIVLECFVNDVQLVRLKCDRLNVVLRMLEGLEEPDRCSFLATLVACIKTGKAKETYLTDKTFDSVLELCQPYSWANDITRELEARRQELITKDPFDE